MSLDSLSDTIDRALSSAGLDPRAGVLKTATDTIRRALSAAGLDLESPPAARAPGARPVPPGARPVPPGARPGPAPVPAPGSFLTRRFQCDAGVRQYKLYTPASVPAGGRSLPLVVMLHGCKQNPDDFAAGTRMNELAERHGFVVVYPAQSRNANGSNCWNWFQPADQQRDQGEPAIIAGLVREVMADCPIDPDRVFVAGLSAGGAMAVILGTTYPDLFKAVGAHSGLAHGAARDVASAFSAMHGGSSGSPVARDAAGVPTIVFQGDQDTTVIAANADAIIRQALGAAEGLDASPSVQTRRATGSTLGCTTTVYADRQGRVRAEKWVVRGGAHAWAGGSRDGSFTDPQGPDASAEMVRFFLDR